MPATSEHNIYYPSGSSNYALIADLGALAQSTDDAIQDMYETALSGITLYPLNRQQLDAYPTDDLMIGQEAHVQGGNDRFRWDGSTWVQTNRYEYTKIGGTGGWNPGYINNFLYSPHSYIERTGNIVNLQLWAKRTAADWNSGNAIDWNLPEWAWPRDDLWDNGSHVSYPDRTVRFSVKTSGVLRWERQSTPINRNQVVLFRSTWTAHDAVKI